MTLGIGSVDTDTDGDVDEDGFTVSESEWVERKNRRAQPQTRRVALAYTLEGSRPEAVGSSQYAFFRLSFIVRAHLTLQISILST